MKRSAILSILSVGSALTCAAPQSLAQVVLVAPPSENVLRAGKEVPLRTREELSTKGKRLRVGQRIQMEVAAPVISDSGVTVIPAGTPAVGEVTEVRNKGMWGKSGYISARVLSLRLGDRQIRLSGTFDDKGVTGTGGVVAAIATIPIAGFLTTGTSAFIPSGSAVKGFLDEDIVFQAVAATPPPASSQGGSTVAAASPPSPHYWSSAPWVVDHVGTQCTAALTSGPSTLTIQRSAAPDLVTLTIYPGRTGAKAGVKYVAEVDFRGGANSDNDWGTLDAIGVESPSYGRGMVVRLAGTPALADLTGSQTVNFTTGKAPFAFFSLEGAVGAMDALARCERAGT